MDNEHRSKVENLLKQTAEIDNFNNSLEQDIRLLSQAIAEEKSRQTQTIRDKDLQRNLSDKVSNS